MSLIIAVALPLPRSHMPKHYQCRVRRICLPRGYVCMHHCFDFRHKKNHSRPKIYRCHAPLSGDYRKVPLIENHSTPWRNSILQTTNSTVPACMLDGSVHVQVRVHTPHNTCATKHMCRKHLHVCTSAHGLHATSRFHRSRSHS